jgi:hypothetical protein
MDVSIGHVATELLSETDAGQFSASLFGCNVEVENAPSEIYENEDKEEEVEELEEKCLFCRKNCSSANKSMLEHIKRCQTTMRNSKKVGTHFLRDPMVVSLNLEDYLIQDVYTWQPEKMLLSGRSLVCWDSSCHGREGTKFKYFLRGTSLKYFRPSLIQNDVNISGTISVKECDHRSVEGIDSNGFIVYPIYQCSCCHRTKSSLELCDLLKMRVSPYILRRCPVVTMAKTCYSSQLAELILTLMTTELGAGQISTFIAKKRAALWVSQARVYLEAHVANSEDVSSLKAFGFIQTRSKSVRPNHPLFHQMLCIKLCLE